MTTLPINLPECDPRARFFPREWKESYFRRHYNAVVGGYICPNCNNVFRGVVGLRQLHADHKRPMSRGGLTVWENMVLLCKQCNLAKGASLDESKLEEAYQSAD